MQGKKIVDYDAKSMKIRGKRILLFGGEIHYFRIPNKLWEDRLMKMKQAECNFVSTYVPWNWHEPREGKYRWSGDQDLDRFLRLCKKHNLYVVLKPGPYICAEWDFGGFPDWLMTRKRKLGLRLLDEEYLKSAEKWFHALSSVIRPHLITNGGKIILFQVENEYDHMIRFGDVPISREEALEYISRLVEIVKGCGIDIPLFTNEGEFVRGTEIIDTRTFYPNIPWLWNWEFDHFEEKIEKSKVEQPDKPVQIHELESGWFDQFGQPKAEVPVEVLETIMRSVLAYGASLLNVYMFAGGTTWPYWGCRGDACDVLPVGTGSATSFDFGVSPIREWGELDKAKYYACRRISLFLKSFPELITGTEICRKDSFRVELEEAKSMRLLKKYTTEEIRFLYDTFEKIKAIVRKGSKSGLLFVRNLEESKRHISVVIGKHKIPAKGKIEVLPRSANLFPFELSIPGSQIRIDHCTSELLLKKNIAGTNIVILYGKKGQKGEIVLENVKEEAKIISGKISQFLNGGYLRLAFTHEGINVFKLSSTIFVILDDFYAGRVWHGNGWLITGDIYLVESSKTLKDSILLELQIQPVVKRKIYLLSDSKPGKIAIDGHPVRFNFDKETKGCKFEFSVRKVNPIGMQWIDSWKYTPDDEELSGDYDDSRWKLLDKPIPLEKAGMIEHGYVWYRARFGIPDGLKNIKMKFDTGGIDRAYFYINGRLVWRGIGTSVINIQKYVQEGDNLLAIRYYNAFHTKAHPHEGPIQKYSGIQSPVEIHGFLNNKKWSKDICKFRVRAQLNGILNGYQKFEYNDTHWMDIADTKKYVCGEDMRGIVWFRRKFRYKKEKNWESSLKLVVPYVSERCLILINGKPIGICESVGPQFEFYVPDSFLNKENLLAIVVEGPGFHRALPDVMQPAVLEEPYWEYHYAAKKVELKIST